MDPHFKHQSCASSAFCDSFKSERADRSHHTGTSKSLARVFVKRRSRGASVINHDTNLYLNSICCMFVIHDFYAFCAYKHFHVALEMIALCVLCMCIQYGSIQMICFSQLTKRFTKKKCLIAQTYLLKISLEIDGLKKIFHVIEKRII